MRQFLSRFLLCTPAIFLLATGASSGINPSEFTVPVHVQGVVKFREPGGSSQGWRYPDTIWFVLTTTVEDKQYVLRGDFRLDVGDYKGHLVGHDHLELLVPDGKVRKYKIIRVGPIPDYSSKALTQPTSSPSGSLAPSLPPSAAQQDHLPILECVAFGPGPDGWHVSIINRCQQAINLWWGPYDKSAESGKMTKKKMNLRADKSATELISEFDAEACPAGYKLSYKVNPNDTVVLWAHRNSLECVRSPGY